MSWVPSTTAGPRTNFCWPVESQATIASSEESGQPPAMFSGSVQSRAYMSYCTRSVIQTGSEVSAGSVVGSVDSSPSPSRSAARNAAPRTSSGISAAPGPSVGASSAAAASSSAEAASSEALSVPSVGASASGERTAEGSMVVGLMRSRTGRNRMSAERRMSSRVSSEGVPGMATTMF